MCYRKTAEPELLVSDTKRTEALGPEVGGYWVAGLSLLCCLLRI